MFEEEKEIRLHDYKKMRYALSYMKSIIRYRNRKIKIPILEIWGSSQCNLSCKECMNRIPFSLQKKTDTDIVLRSIQRLSRIVKLNRIVISGGEPFLNDELYKVVHCLNQLPDIKKIYIITNATLVPDDNLLYALSNTEKAIKIIMNEYYEVPNKICEIKDKLKKRKIPYEVRRWKDYDWKGIGNDIRKPLHFETGRMIYAECRMRGYAVLNDDIITKCPRGILGKTYSETKDIGIEHLKISELKTDVYSRAKLAVCLNPDIHKEYCRMCFGLSDENPYTDKPGIQI